MRIDGILVRTTSAYHSASAYNGNRAMLFVRPYPQSPLVAAPADSYIMPWKAGLKNH
jgi:hypothetical protein